MKIRGRTILLTGASGGLGEAIARSLAARGGELVLSGRRRDVLEPLAEELGARVVPADLTRREEVERLAAEAGEVDILVANAGLPASGLLSDFSLEEMDRAVDVNLRAPLVLTRILLDRMVAQGEGHLLYVSSLAGKLAPHRSSVYSATKFGLRGFALGLREDLRSKGVGVSAIFPGPITDAGMWASAEVDLPRFVRLRNPTHVGQAVVRAIERNRAEIGVADLPMRFFSAVAAAAPRPVSALNRRLGAEEFADAAGASEGHRSRR
jgi:short-subunit dehydrogenase